MRSGPGAGPRCTWGPGPPSRGGLTAAGGGLTAGRCSSRRALFVVSSPQEARHGPEGCGSGAAVLLPGRLPAGRPGGGEPARGDPPGQEPGAGQGVREGQGSRGAAAGPARGWGAVSTARTSGSLAA